MATPESVQVDISILDRSYKVSCAPEHKSLLQEAAQELDRRMREVRSHSDGIGPERAAVMAGLNAVYEMLEQKSASSWDVADVKRRIKDLEERLDRCFFEQETLF
ncbi:MAG: cell division protein ZapA [Betaproteobacteria bacterium]|nr:cell division protein ZapA [Betaproteobacteria bacterium]MDE2211865.1 cell division protein ZapA [Betaproteobacteria bacterium]MDE2624526.1 cell division protein ZapA [Betaproteobacteria bacterium]